MTTAYNLIFDLFMVQIKDWKLDALYAVSVPNFETFLEGFLIQVVPEFSVFCDQSLDRDDTANTFDETLTDKNKQMLARLMIQMWMEKEVQDVRQMNLHITGKDWKTYSEAQNLKGKSDYLIIIKEKNSQSIIDYAWHGQDFTDWIAGDFPTGA